MSARKILIPLDSSAISEQIMPTIQRLFDPGQTSLTLLAVAQTVALSTMTNPVVPSPGHPIYAQSLDFANAVDHAEWQRQWERQRQELEDNLKRVQQRLQNVGYAVSTMIRVGDPIQEIVTCAEDGEFDALAMVTHGRTGLNRLMFGSVTEKVMRTVSIPILIMRSAAQTAPVSVPGEKLARAIDERQFLTIAVASDGSAHAQRAVSLACELQKALGADLKLLVTVEEDVDAAQAQQMMQATLAQMEELHAQPATVPLVGPIDINVEHYLTENPMDLLIIGGFKDRGAGAATDIGRTAQQIAQYAPTSVLVTKGYQNGIKSILACIAPNDSAVTKVAIHLSQLLHAKLQVLHVLPSSAEQRSHLVDMSTMPLNEILARGPIQREAATDAIVPLSFDDAIAEGGVSASFLQETVTVLETSGIERAALLVRHGPTVRTILQTIHEENPGLVIVGSQSGPGYFLGSAASTVVGLATQSVLVVRTK